MNNVSKTDELCTQCGLCCDGSIFADIELESESEKVAVEALGLEIDTDGPPLLLLPCTGLDGTRCSVYKNRPGRCRTFECRLLQKANAGAVSVLDAQRIIAETRAHVAALDRLCREAGEESEDLPLQERCVEVLARPGECGDEVADHTRSKIAQGMDTMGRMLQQHFVGD
jgi:Fe-S-cluster containining protein